MKGSPLTVLAWTVSWGLVGFVLGSAGMLMGGSPPEYFWPTVIPVTVLSALAGVILGACFAVLEDGAERRPRKHGLQPGRMALWGGAGGAGVASAILGLVVLAGGSIADASLAAAMVGGMAIVGGLSAGSMARAARRARSQDFGRPVQSSDSRAWETGGGDSAFSLMGILAVSALAWSVMPGAAPLAADPASPGRAAPVATPASAYEELVTLFREWREFERPDFDGWVPDYTPEAMARQFAELPTWKERLWAMDIHDWPVEQQIDWHLVRAEMNGLDFDHKIRRPWARNPAFYQMMHPAESDVPAHEGPLIHGGIDTWTYDYPLSREDAAELAERFGAIPAVLEQARGNLAGSNARDLWHAGIRTFHRQAANIRSYAEEVRGTSRALDRALDEAARASDEFADWIEAELPGKTGPSGVGKDAYTWYMHNVHLSPYSWEEQLTIMRRELARSHASMLLEENRNRDQPELERIASAEEYDRRLNQSVDRYMAFLEREEVETVEPWMDAALRAVNGSFSPADPGEIRNFFLEVIYRDPDAFRPHMHHWIELARMREDPHPSPIRSTPSLYNIFDHRSEGLATGVEEMFMHLGLLDENPDRARELVWIMLAQRAARATSGLMLHGGEFDMEEAVAYAGKWTPKGWLPDGDLVRGEQQLYLAQPGYGTSYVAGKVQIEDLMAEVALDRGSDFTVKGFFDGFYDAGVIPTVLVRWEMIGEKHPILEVGHTPQEAPWN